MKKKLVQAIADEHDLVMKHAEEVESDYSLIQSDSDSLSLMVLAELKAIRYELVQLRKENFEQLSTEKKKE